MKTILITGASRGIGRAIAEKFLGEGWSVLGTSTSGEKIDLGENFSIYKLDYLSDGDVDQLISSLKSDGKEIDVLVNNAGVDLDYFEDRVKTDILRETLEVNLIGQITLTEGLLDGEIIKDGGMIFNISSMAGVIGRPTGSMMPAYKISKVALNMYTRTLASALRDRSIDICSIDPGWVKTDMGGSSAPKNPSIVGDEIYQLVQEGNINDKFFSGTTETAW